MTQHITKARETCLVYIDDLLSSELLDTCIEQIKKSIAIELFLNPANKIHFEKNPVIFNKCCQLINTGGSIFFISNAATTDTTKQTWQCLTDFNLYSYYNPEGNNIPQIEKSNSMLYQQALNLFDIYKLNSTPYLVEKDDIQIHFSVSEKLIFPGDSIEIIWKVDGADKILIQGLGEVAPYGRKKIFINNDTIIKIGASNAKQSQIKSIFVQVAPTELNISYDIGCISSVTKQYASLVDSSNYPHVYGIAAGNQARLTWSVPHASLVRIKPFNLEQTSGEFTFTPADSIVIEIEATIKGSVFCRKIELLLFPIPLFKEKIPTLPSLHLSTFNINIPTSFKEKTRQFKNTEYQTYLALREEILERNKAIFSKKINQKNIYTSLFYKLKNKYFTRKNILTQLTSLQPLYEQPGSNIKEPL